MRGQNGRKDLNNSAQPADCQRRETNAKPVTSLLLRRRCRQYPDNDSNFRKRWEQVQEGSGEV